VVAGVTVTVTDALVLRPLLEDRGRITESIRILVPVDKSVDRMKHKYFQITTKRVRRSQQFQVEWCSSVPDLERGCQRLIETIILGEMTTSAACEAVAWRRIVFFRLEHDPNCISSALAVIAEWCRPKHHCKAALQ